MTQQAKSMSGPGPPRAPPVSSSDWEQHRATIDDLWMTRAMSLEQLMDTMRSEHNFAPSPMDYLKQLKKWDMHKSSPAQPSTTKRPHPPASPDLGVMHDPLPSISSPGTKRSRHNDTAPQYGSHAGVLSPDHESSGIHDGPDQHGPGQEGSELEGSELESFEVQVTSDSEASLDSESQESSDYQEDGPWLCFCGKHGEVAGFSEALIQASSCGDSSSATMCFHEMEDVIERVESAAEFFLYTSLEGDAFRLYAMFLKWALNHDGPLCRCTRDLISRARTGCAISALDRSDLEVANALLLQTRGLSPLNDRQSLASWLFHESLFNWKLLNSRGLLSISGDSNWLVRLTNQVDSLFNASLCHDAAVDWQNLAVDFCEELSPFIEHSDGTKRRVRSLLQRLQDSLVENPEPSRDYSMRMFHTGAVRYCLRWMQASAPALPLLPLSTRDKCDFRGGPVCTLHGTDPDPPGPHPTTDFLAYWARLRSELSDGSVPVWVKKLKSTGIQPTEFLANVVRCEVWFEDRHGNTRTPWTVTDEEIINVLKGNHVSYRVDLVNIQLLEGGFGRANCRSAGRELVRDHLAVTPIPG